MTLNAGTKLEPHDIESLLGAGGMGEVYRARDVRLNRTVVIKVLPKSFSADADRLQRFTQEARAAAALNHGDILSISILARPTALFVLCRSCWRGRQQYVVARAKKKKNVLLVDSDLSLRTLPAKISKQIL